MTQDETIALWNKCQAAKKVLLDQGKKEFEAHEAAKAVWNSWAQGLLDEKSEMEKEGTWKSFRELGVLEAGMNENTKNWYERSKVQFLSLSFVSASNNNSIDPIKQRVVCYGGCINFSEFIFPREVSFKKADFHLFTKMVSVEFKGMANFEEAKFFKDADFNYTIFNNIAYFMKTTFMGNLAFHVSKFYSVAIFDTVRFIGFAEFRDSQFLGKAILNTIFSRAKFLSRVNFQNTTFLNNVLFQEVTFIGDAEFEGSSFTEGGNFSKSTFYQKASFASIISKRSFSLADTHFSLVPDFTEADFHQPPRLDNIHLDKTGGWWRWSKVDENVSAMYRALKRLAEDSKDHNNEMKFFAGEMRTARFNTDFPWPGGGRVHYKEANSKRKQTWEKEQTAREQRNALWQKHIAEKTEEQQPKQPENTKLLPPFVERKGSLWPNGARFWFGMGYEFFSDFGRSLLRPLLAIIVLKLAFSAYIFSHRTEEAQNFGYSSSMQQLCYNVTGVCTISTNVKRCLKTNPFHATTFIAAQYGLPFVPASSKQKNMLAKACLFGWVKQDKIAVLPDRVIFWGAVQNFLLLIFLFLFGLAIRNHFRMK